MTTTNDHADCAIDGQTLPTRVPHTLNGLCELVRQAVGEGNAIYPVAGRTKLGLGLPPARKGIAIDVSRLSDVDDFPARDMTITVGAGITLQRLDEIARKEKLHLPVDVALPGEASLGGAIATNQSGSRRFGNGTLRDCIIGIQGVNYRGEVFKAGGRVVKNVAGYDLMKLLTGSLGTLGIITQVTLKLKPVSEASQWLLLPVPMLDVPTIIERFQATRTRPVAFDLLNTTAANALGDGFPKCDELHRLMAILFEDNAQAVAWQVEQFEKELPGSDRKKLIHCDAGLAARLEAHLRDFTHGPGDLKFKAMVRPAEIWNAFQDMSMLSPRPALRAHVGNGILHGNFTDKLNEDQAKIVAARLAELSKKAGGNFTLTACPFAWKAQLPVWGVPTADRALMAVVKKALDPNNVFNPGRFVNGI